MNTASERPLHNTHVVSQIACHCSRGDALDVAVVVLVLVLVLLNLRHVWDLSPLIPLIVTAHKKFNMFTLNPSSGGSGGGATGGSSARKEQLWYFGQLVVYFGLLHGVYMFFAAREASAIRNKQ